MGVLDEIGWPTLPEVYSPAVGGGGGRPCTYSTRLPPFSRWRCTATAAAAFSCRCRPRLWRPATCLDSSDLLGFHYMQG